MEFETGLSNISLCCYFIALSSGMCDCVAISLIAIPCLLTDNTESYLPISVEDMVCMHAVPFAIVE